MEITSEIKDMESWEEASKWLERHGWGPGLIDEQKTAWDAAKAPKPIETKKEEPVLVITKVAEPVKTKRNSLFKKGN